MTLGQLINHVGPENIKVQPLKDTITSIETVKGGHKVTFVTGQISPVDLMFGADQNTMVGLVLWVQKGKLDAARRACNGTGYAPDPRLIGERLRHVRECKGVSLRRLARSLKISAAFLSDLELGRRRWSPKRIKAVEEALNLFP